MWKQIYALFDEFLMKPEKTEGSKQKAEGSGQKTMLDQICVLMCSFVSFARSLNDWQFTNRPKEDSNDND
jgi:hypothetical protein